MTKLRTISESISDNELQEAFQTFVNEAGPRDYKPTTDKVKKAIKGRKYVGIYYEEEGNDKVLSGFRLIEPYVFGRGYKSADGVVTHKNEYYLRAFVIKESKKAENKQLHKINRKSVSKSRRVPYWRLFKFDRITIFEELRFVVPKAQELFNPDDQMIGKILQVAKFPDE